MLFAVSKLVGALVRLESWLVLLALAAAWAALCGRRRLAAGLAVLLAALIAAFAALPLGDLLLRPLEGRFAARPALAHVDGIVVLGGPEDDRAGAAHGDWAFNGSAERLMAAVLLARRWPDARLIYTGVPGPGAGGRDMVAAFFAEAGLGERLERERAARNTAENVAFAKAMARPEPGQVWVVVTSAWHMPRAVGIFCRQGWPVVPWPVDWRSGRFADGIGWKLARHLTDWNDGIKEWVGLVSYRLLGRTDRLLPGPGCAGDGP